MNTRTFFSVLFLTFLVALLVVYPGRSEEPTPPPTQRPDGLVRPRPAGQRPEDHTPFAKPVPDTRQDLAAPAMAPSAAVPVGESGLSFRFVQVYGVTEEAYLADTVHLNFPDGLHVDANDNLWVAEARGARALKFSSSGDHLLTLGRAGLRIATDNEFFEPSHAAVDPSGDIWVVDAGPSRVVEFNSVGEFQGQLGETWGYGSGDDRFANPRGVAFDSSGRIFVADSDNHRVQVFDADGNYLLTLGETGVPGSDNSHFNFPERVAVDAADNLYVTDSGNHRVQIFDSNLDFIATLGTGICGAGDYQFCWPQQTAIDGGGNIYVADMDNCRVQVYDDTHTYLGTLGQTGNCGSTNGLFKYPRGVAVDSAGKIYVSDTENHRVQEFDSSYAYQRTIGVTGVPYLTDDDHINAPYGIEVDASGNMYVTERWGHRLLKFDPQGNLLWAIGEPGIYGDDDQHFGQHWEGPLGVAVDGDGNVYVADPTNHRVQRCTAAGTCETFAGVTGVPGSSGPYLNYPRGVAVDAAGNVYISDSHNHRVQKCTPGGDCDTFAGTGFEGSGDLQLAGPHGLDVDAAGNVYVADAWNYRVQVFNGAGDLILTIGTTGECSGEDFAHFCEPHDVAVDKEGRIYVADAWNNRVQVYDSNGAYLTTVGGWWEPDPGMFRSASGVALDEEGNLYVADQDNHRIQRFAPGYPGWVQANINGFGDRYQSLPSLEAFGQWLYVGTWNIGGGVAQVWRTEDGRTWENVTPDWASPKASVVPDIQAFGSHAYFGVCREDQGGNVWRTDGTIWEQVVDDGFGNADNQCVTALAVFDRSIYAATSNTSTGSQIWRSTSGDHGTWEKASPDGFGAGGEYLDVTMEVYGDNLYLGVRGADSNMAELWRSADGTTWTAVFTDGLGNPNNTHVASFEEFKGLLYIGLRNVTDGGELWRSSDGLSWIPVFIGGLGDSDNMRPYGLTAFGDWLYLVINNPSTGTQVWRTADGDSWEQVVSDGWGSVGMVPVAHYFDKGGAVFRGSLFIGAHHGGGGAQIWRKLHEVYLPLVLKDSPP